MRYKSENAQKKNARRAGRNVPRSRLGVLSLLLFLFLGRGIALACFELALDIHLAFLELARHASERASEIKYLAASEEKHGKREQKYQYLRYAKAKHT